MPPVYISLKFMTCLILAPIMAGSVAVCTPPTFPMHLVSNKSAEHQQIQSFNHTKAQVGMWCKACK